LAKKGMDVEQVQPSILQAATAGQPPVGSKLLCARFGQDMFHDMFGVYRMRPNRMCLMPVRLLKKTMFASVWSPFSVDHDMFEY
jgi:hypothetical protein